MKIFQRSLLSSYIASQLSEKLIMNNEKLMINSFTLHF